MVGVLAARHAAHVRARKTRSGALVGDVRQEFHVVPEVGNLQLRELFLTDGLDAEWHVLQALLRLERGDNDFIDAAGVLRLLCLYYAGAREHRARQRDSAP